MSDPRRGEGRALRLSAEQRQEVEDAIAANTGLQVYRQLKMLATEEQLAATGGVYLGNCCSCSEKQ
jgi:hypothetical protein